MSKFYPLLPRESRSKKLAKRYASIERKASALRVLLRYLTK